VAAAPAATNAVLVPVRELDPAARYATWVARRIGRDGFVGIHVAGSARPGRDPRGTWWDVSGGAPPLELLAGDLGPAEAVLDRVWTLPRGESQFVTVVLPEQFRRRSLLRAVARPEFRLKLKLLREPGVVTLDVPAVGAGAAPARRLVCRVLVSGGHAASMRAVNYARSLGLDGARAVFFAFDDVEAKRLRREWEHVGAGLPLDIHEAPFRDLGDPLLAYVRGLTADREAVVLVVVPELVVRGPARLLHNQRALYVKRLLLFEPRVVLAAVPFQLG
jgi:hypothetical protein